MPKIEEEGVSVRPMPLRKFHAKTQALIERLHAADEAKPCVACSGSGVSSKGQPCYPCSGTGKEGERNKGELK